MCLVETKLYQQPDGQEERIERVHYCAQAADQRLCSNVDREPVQRAHLEERRPTQDRIQDGYIVTQGSHGTERVYRDVTALTSRHGERKRRKKSHRPDTTSKRTSEDSPSSVSSPLHAESIAAGLSRSPPSRRKTAGLGGFQDSRPSPPGVASEFPLRTVLPGGTAVYVKAHTMNLPRAAYNERRRPIASSGETPISSQSKLTAERAELDAASISQQRAAKVQFSPAVSSFPDSPQSTGLDTRPSNADDRHDSAQEPLEYRWKPGQYANSTSQQTEDERQARIARERMAATEQRQKARRKAQIAARETSTEWIDRNRREAREKLEGHRKAGKAENLRALGNNARPIREQDAQAMDVDANFDMRDVRHELEETYSSTGSPSSFRPFTPKVQIHQHSPDCHNKKTQQRREGGFAQEQSRGDRPSAGAATSAHDAW
ncbi:hypothetical protein EJ03DRAFT_58731 [Teratosphaeria nubilosa]|uniref:Uncharacterized protein n=1 Tax=Teratosphaeria nubilosa TaxID=161662 RepID=A0A6G1KU49_9PEZI|nr:hypothetical protein EJ03DRAFT_58731 [Teratosphaeria nubilosa]